MWSDWQNLKNIFHSMEFSTWESQETYFETLKDLISILKVHEVVFQSDSHKNESKFLSFNVDKHKNIASSKALEFVEDLLDIVESKNEDNFDRKLHNRCSE